MPVEDCGGERGKIPDFRNRVAFAISRECGKEPVVLRSEVAVDARVCFEEGGNRNHEAGGLNVAEPFLVSKDCWVFRHGFPVIW